MHKYYRIFFSFIIAACIIALGSAYFLQRHYNLVPCKLCDYQRMAYFVVVAVSFIGILFPLIQKLCSFLVVLIVFANLSVAFTQLSSENGWFHLSSACGSSIPQAETLEQFKELIVNKDTVACDQVQWELFYISMAGWNFIYSSVLFVFSFIFSTSFARKLHNVEEDFKLK